MKINELLYFETDKGKELLHVVHTCMKEYGMWEKITQGVLLAFSGGADSVFLALTLLYLKNTTIDFPLCLCHVHHGIRKEGADRDLAFCQEFAKHFGIEIISKYVDVPSLAKQTGTGVEECARNVRYSIFNEIMLGRNDISCVLTAHNATDNVETVIHRLMRGTGLHGLCGISPVRDDVIFRPILYISKKDIVSFLTENDISFVVDETNTDERYTRNFIRNEILPDLERITPRPEVSISRFVQNLREDDSCLMSFADAFLREQNLPFVRVDDFQALPRAIQYRVLYLMAKTADDAFSFQKVHIDLILSSIVNRKKQRISLLDDLYFVLEKGMIYLEKQDNEVCYSQILPLNKKAYSAFFGATFLFCDEDTYQSYKNVYKNSISVSISSAIIQGELFVRKKKSQDCYRVRKMTRKLKTLIQSLRLPAIRSNKIPVICDEDGVLYVPPFGVREDVFCESKVKNNFYIMIIYSDDTKMPWQD